MFNVEKHGAGLLVTRDGQIVARVTTEYYPGKPLPTEKWEVNFTGSVITVADLIRVVEAITTSK